MSSPHCAYRKVSLPVKCNVYIFWVLNRGKCNNITPNDFIIILIFLEINKHLINMILPFMLIFTISLTHPKLLIFLLSVPLGFTKERNSRKGSPLPRIRQAMVATWLHHKKSPTGTSCTTLVDSNRVLESTLRMECSGLKRLLMASFCLGNSLRIEVVLSSLWHF